MDISVKRNEILEWIKHANDETIDLLDQIKNSEKYDWWETLSEDQKIKIAEGQRSIDAGEVVTHEVVKRKYGL